MNDISAMTVELKELSLKYEGRYADDVHTEVYQLWLPS